jgi:hypothetical protein
MAFGMPWMRRSIRLGSWLALLALAFQLTLSFGHIHTEDFAPAADIHATVDADHDGGNPAKPDHHGLGHDDCAICATTALLATLVIPLPPAFDLPATLSFAFLDETDARQWLGAAPRLFQARAPPRA